MQLLFSRLHVFHFLHDLKKVLIQITHILVKQRSMLIVLMTQWNFLLQVLKSLKKLQNDLCICELQNTVRDYVFNVPAKGLECDFRNTRNRMKSFCPEIRNIL